MLLAYCGPIRPVSSDSFVSRISNLLIAGAALTFMLYYDFRAVRSPFVRSDGPGWAVFIRRPDSLESAR